MCVPSPFVPKPATSACAGVLEHLEHERARPLAHDETVARAVEWPRRAFGLGVARGGGEHDVEHGGVHRVQLLRAARDHQVLPAAHDGLVRVADALAAGGARAARRHDPPRDAEELREVRRAGVAHELQIVGACDALEAALRVERRRIDLHRRRAAARRAVRDARRAVGDERAARQSRVGERQLGGARGHERDATHAAHFLPRIVSRHGEVGHGSAQPRIESLVAVPLRHHAHAGALGQQPRANRRPVAAQR